MEKKKLEKKIKVNQVIDFEKVQAGILAKDLEYFQYIKQKWLSKKKGAPLEIASDLAIVFPHPWLDGFHPDRIKAFFEGVKDQFIRHLICEIVIGDCIYNTEHLNAIKKFSEFLKKEKLV